MINIRELEQRWIKYKIKSYIPYGVALSAVFVLSLTVYFLQNDKPKKEKQTLHVEKVQPAKQIVVQKQQVVKKATKVEKKPQTIQPVKTIKKQPTVVRTEKTNIIKPSMNFIEEIENQPMQIIEEKPQQKKQHIVEEKVIEKNMVVEVVPQEVVQVQQEEKVVEKKQPKKMIKISRESSHGDINKLVKRFKKTNSPQLSLFIAKKYYDMGNYHQSYNYALITNQIDYNIEPSWIIFSKSLVKLGEKEQAISTLRKYIQHTQSNNAQLLLDDIVSGKFR